MAAHRRRYCRSLRYVVSRAHRRRLLLPPWLTTVWRFAVQLQAISPDSQATQSTILLAARSAGSAAPPRGKPQSGGARRCHIRGRKDGLRARDLQTFGDFAFGQLYIFLRPLARLYICTFRWRWPGRVKELFDTAARRERAAHAELGDGRTIGDERAARWPRRAVAAPKP